MCLGEANSMVAERWALREWLLLADRIGIQFLCIELDANVVFDLTWGQISNKLTSDATRFCMQKAMQ